MKVKGLNELMAQFTDLQDIDKSRVAMAGGSILLKGSQEKAPVKTGFLRDSGFVEPTSDGCNMGFSAEYAFFAEYGTSKWQGKPYIRPTIDESGNDILQAMRDEADEVIKEKL
jgi:HK97 gp10 family phage protein